MLGPGPNLRSLHPKAVSLTGSRKPEHRCSVPVLLQYAGLVPSGIRQPYLGCSVRIRCQDNSGVAARILNLDAPENRVRPHGSPVDNDRAERNNETADQCEVLQAFQRSHSHHSFRHLQLISSSRSRRPERQWIIFHTHQ